MEARAIWNGRGATCKRLPERTPQSGCPLLVSVAYCPVPTSSFSRFCLALSAHFREGKSEPCLVGFPGLLSPNRPVEAGPRITAVTAVGRALRPWQVDRIQGGPITSDAADPQGGEWLSPLWSTPMNYTSGSFPSYALWLRLLLVGQRLPGPLLLREPLTCPRNCGSHNRPSDCRT